MQSKRNSNTSSLYNNAGTGSGLHVIEAVRNNVMCKQSITTAYGSIKETAEDKSNNINNSSGTRLDLRSSSGQLLMKEQDASYEADKIEHVALNHSKSLS